MIEKNCICTPHVAFASNEAMYKRAVIVYDDFKTYLAGSLINLIK